MHTIFLGLEGVIRQKMSYNFKITSKFLRWHVGWEVGIPSKLVGPVSSVGMLMNRHLNGRYRALLKLTHIFIIFQKKASPLNCNKLSWVSFFHLLDSCGGFSKDQRNSLFFFKAAQMLKALKLQFSWFLHIKV